VGDESQIPLWGDRAVTAFALENIGGIPLCVRNCRRRRRCHYAPSLARFDVAPRGMSPAKRYAVHGQVVVWAGMQQTGAAALNQPKLRMLITMLSIATACRTHGRGAAKMQVTKLREGALGRGQVRCEILGHAEIYAVRPAIYALTCLRNTGCHGR